VNGPAFERVLDGAWYRLTVRDGAPVAWLDDRDGRRWGELCLLASVDALDGPDETLGVEGPEVAATTGATMLTWTLRSSRWTSKRLIVEARPDGLAVHAEIEGRGRLTDVRLLCGRTVRATGSGLLLSGARFETLFSPAPAHPLKIARRATEGATIGVVSGSEPGFGSWFFTPAPLCFAASREPAPSGTELPAGSWLWFGLEAALGDATFPSFDYDAIDRGFGFRLPYEAKRVVDGTWRTPVLVIGQATDPYAAIAAHCRRLVEAGLARPEPHTDDPPGWWREPIFCGWGAQSRLALADGVGMHGAPGYATQANYDSFLSHLERHGIVPGTIVIDDKWQAAYGTCRPDGRKWPDLRGWIARRHAAGQRVLLWWKAWDAEGVPAEWCVRSETGEPLGLDPTHPEAAAAIRDAVRTMLAREGLDADGLKIDFTARTPSGVATRHYGKAWGIALLHALLVLVAREARRVKPDTLLVGHTPNPWFGAHVDMVRLNDMIRLDDPEPRVDVVPQMRYRAAVVRAALPEHLIDTDDWCPPDLATWRRYLAIKAELGVPALYYATGLDLSGEDFEPEDYAAIRRVWATYRAANGLAAHGDSTPAAL
jgi:hypothetical protein